MPFVAAPYKNAFGLLGLRVYLALYVIHFRHDSQFIVRLYDFPKVHLTVI